MALDFVDKETLNNLSPKELSPFDPDTVQKVIRIPNKRTYTTLTFGFEKPGGEELQPGKRFVFVIPKEYSGRVVRDIIVRHRKDLSRATNSDWDPDGAYSRVQIKELDSGEWKGWKDPEGYSSDKYAEPRSPYDPEDEVLHDWLATVGEIRPKLVSLENVGKTKNSISNIHGVEIVFFPEGKEVDYSLQIFSPGTKFVDIKKGIKLPFYGGGLSYGGTYPGALKIRQDSGLMGEEHKEQTGQEYYAKDGNLHIKLRSGRRLLSLELAVGDTHPDGIQNKDGHVGTLGWAKIYAGLRKEDQRVRYFMEKINVPPAGILTGGPEVHDSLVQEGDEIIVESRADTAYLMGYRVTYGK